MEELYLSRRIHTIPQLNLDTDCWVPKADIFWVENGMQRHHMVVGPNDRFKVIDDALTYALEVAKAWINDQQGTTRIRDQ
jgi:hypothetical protein